MKPLTNLMAVAFNKTAIALAAVVAPLMLPAAAMAESFSFSYSTGAPQRIVHVAPQPVYTHYYPQRVVVREQVSYRPMHAGYWGSPNTVVVHKAGWNNQHRHWNGHRGHGKDWREHGRRHDRGHRH